VGNQKNFIEINGKRYDAVTGAMLKGSAPAQPVVDGFVKRPRHTTSVPVVRGGHGLQKQVQHSKTLMRAAVKKPAAGTHKHLTPDVAAAKPTNVVKAAKQAPAKPTITPRTAAISPDRQQLAHATTKSAMVHKFGAPQMPAPLHPSIEPLEVRPTPPPAAKTAVMVQHSKTADLLDRALAAAQSHNEPLHELKKPLHKRIAHKVGMSSKAMAISTTVVAGLLLGGFYAYQNVPNLAMRVAATRAGFNASMPGYSPSGFAFRGPVQYSAGQVVVSFKSNTDDRTYKLTQQTSSWSSETLLNNYVAAAGKEYQTYQDRGRTIYIYDGSSATWVNGGVWYQIEGKSDLSSDQLVRIAASL
jgi:hypothetical protein